MTASRQAHNQLRQHQLLHSERELALHPTTQHVAFWHVQTQDMPLRACPAFPDCTYQVLRCIWGAPDGAAERQRHQPHHWR